MLRADGCPQDTSTCLDTGPDPSTYTGSPCTDLSGGPRLRDFNGDGLAAIDPGACERENTGLVPGAVSNLRWIDGQTLEWDADPAAVEYHVYRDEISTLGYSHFGVCRNDLDPVRTDLLLHDAETPPEGGCFIYTITSEDNIGAQSTLGLGTCAERSNFPVNVCP